MDDRSAWALLAYRLPREPSTPRITLWRKLRRLGAVQLIDGLVALPATDTVVEQFDWLAEEVNDNGGEAWTWTATGPRSQQRNLLARLTDTTAADYRDLGAEADRLGDDTVTRRDIERLRREYRRIDARDYTQPKDRDRARRADAKIGDEPRLADFRQNGDWHEAQIRFAAC